jgi:hypothetical protein
MPVTQANHPNIAQLMSQIQRGHRRDLVLMWSRCKVGSSEIGSLAVDLSIGGPDLSMGPLYMKDRQETAYMLSAERT